VSPASNGSWRDAAVSAADRHNTRVALAAIGIVIGSLAPSLQPAARLPAATEAADVAAYVIVPRSSRSPLSRLYGPARRASRSARCRAEVGVGPRERRAFGRLDHLLQPDATFQSSRPRYRYRLGVRTRGSQPRDRGSNLHASILRSRGTLTASASTTDVSHPSPCEARGR
jgi:hypothetical protein